MKVILILIAIVIGLFGLAMTACGLLFTVAGAANILALISIVVGAALLWVAWLLWTAGNKPAATAATAPTDAGSTGAGSG